MRRSPLVVGIIAGSLTSLAFAALHQLIISDIWFSLIPMMIAGAVCGLCLAWTYGVLFDGFSTPSWLRYIGLYTALLLLLGLASVLLFEPVVPMAVLIAANEPPTELIMEAIPLTVAFIVASAVLVAGIWERSWFALWSGLITSATLIVLLGLNVSVLGLVDTTGGQISMIAEFLGLLVVIMMGFAGLFLALRGRGPVVEGAEAG